MRELDQKEYDNITGGLGWVVPTVVRAVKAALSFRSQVTVAAVTHSTVANAPTTDGGE